MNKIKFFLVAAILTLTAGTSMAQKTGYISVDNVVALMPEVKKIDTLLQKFQTDTLNTEFASLVQEYNYKDSIINSKDSSKTPASVRKQYRQDMEGLAYQVQNWQAIVQQAMQNKQGQLLQPVYEKVMNTIKTVAKENGYSYVYNQEVLLVAPPADDLLPLVAKKLNIKLPAAAPTAAPKK